MKRDAERTTRVCRRLLKKYAEYYRFGFNGKENDTEWGNQLIQDYGFRLYNPAIAKFLSFDPLAPDYPELTPYQFASNSPISGIDLDGLEFSEAITQNGTRYINAHLALVNSSGLEKEKVEQAALMIKKRFEEVYRGQNPKTGTKYRSWFTYRIVDKVEDVKENEYYMELTTWADINSDAVVVPTLPDEGGRAGRASAIGGPSARLALSYYEDIDYPEMIDGDFILKTKRVYKLVYGFESTAAHEIGHMLGLIHVWSDSYGLYGQSKELFNLNDRAENDVSNGLKISLNITKIRTNLMNSGGHIIPELNQLEKKKAVLLPIQVIQAYNNILNKKVGNPRPEQEKISSENEQEQYKKGN